MKLNTAADYRAACERKRLAAREFWSGKRDRIERMVRGGLSIQTIAAMFFVSTATMRRVVKEFGIEVQK
ncbi:MAG: hypothetical protein EBR82_32975 [Caulobacteraceae bacterium]|nr:hypothetical protein [Caulobacteraceae bacterium]